MAERETDLGQVGSEAGHGEAVKAEKVVTAYRGFYPVVVGNEVEVSQGGGFLFVAKDELEIEQGGGQWMIALRKLEVEQGGCAVMVAGRAKVRRGVIGMLVALRAELKDGSRVLMTLPQALAAGAVAGAVMALAAWWGGRRQEVRLAASHPAAARPM